MRHLPLPMAIMVLLTACGGTEATKDGQVGWSALPNQYARHFQLQVRGAERRVLVFGPGGVQDTVGIYVLKGAVTGRELAVDTPLTRVAVVSTTHLPFFTALGAGNAVVGVAHGDQVRDPLLKQRIQAGKVAEIARADGLDRERLIALDPQALFDYPFGRSTQREDAFARSIAVTEYLEQHPLGRAEWIRFFGVLVGQQERGDSLFQAIAHRYSTVRDLRSFLGEPPVVLFASNWDRTWWAPPGNSYMATLITDAGGRYWFADSLVEGNIPMPLEHVLLAGRGTGHFGVVMAADGAVDALRMAGGDPRVAALDAVRKGGFIGNSARSDLFGAALLEPEVVLQDLRCIFHPHACVAYRPTYFFPIGQ